MGEDERCAQSSGEWPGVRRTFRRGFVGMELCVGGGAREEEGGPRLGRGERRGGGIRLEGEGWMAFNRGGPRTPPEARWAELRAGKEGIEGSASEERLKEGFEEARGVGGEFGSFIEEGVLEVWSLVGFLNGGGGGGIARRSRSCLDIPSSFSSTELAFEPASPFTPLFAPFAFCSGSKSSIEGASWRGFFDEKIREGRRSHCRMSHEDGGQR